MKVAEVQKYLSDFSPDADVLVVVDNLPQPFELLYGGDDGSTKETASRVTFMVNGTEEKSQNKV